MDTQKYIAAIDTHKFYDTISMAIVTGMVTISGASIYLVEKIQTTTIKCSILVVMIMVIYSLLIMYRRCAYYANVARNVSAKIEEGSCNIGVSAVLKNINSSCYVQYRATKSVCRGIYGAIHFLWLTLTTGFTTYFAYLIYLQ